MSSLDPRPSLTPALDALIARLLTLDELRGLRAGDILVVALGAHGTAAASVRSLVGSDVTIGRKKRLIEIGLRPPFFLEGDAPRRLATLMHELLHLDSKKPGALLEQRRHAHRTHAEHERHARDLARRWLDENDPMPILCLAHHGEALMRTWRHRPLDDDGARVYRDKDVYEAPLVIHTRKGARGSWW